MMPFITWVSDSVTETETVFVVDDVVVVVPVFFARGFSTSANPPPTESRIVINFRTPCMAPPPPPPSSSSMFRFVSFRLIHCIFNRISIINSQFSRSSTTRANNVVVGFIKSLSGCFCLISTISPARAPMMRISGVLINRMAYPF